MNKFLVQVNRDGGFANIMSNRRYENDHWMSKPRDSDHGDVQPGDQLLIYCAGGIPKHGMTLAFSIDVEAVSPDHVRFELDEPQFFKLPLSRAKIFDLVNIGTLPNVFRKCGQQGFNIAKLDASSAKIVLDSLNGASVFVDKEAESPSFDPEELQNYTIKDLIGDGCFLEESSSQRFWTA